MQKTASPQAARRFALMAMAGCASISGAMAAQTLRYSFESITDPSSDPVANLAPGATQNGTFVNPGQLSLNSGEEVVVDSVRYQLGQTLLLTNLDAEGATAGHIDTGLNPSGWGMANNNTLNRNYTAMAWVKFGSAAGDNMVFGQLAGNALHLGSRRGFFHSGHWGDDIGPDQSISVPTGTGTWQHVAWTNEGNRQQIYVNGELVVSPVVNGVDTGAGGAAGGGDGSNMVIGTFIDPGSLVGELDEIKVFGDQVLTPAEIRTEMTNTLTPVPLAVVDSARLDNTGYTFTIRDYPPNSIVNPATVELEIDLAAVTPTSVTKAGGITTITWNPPLPDPVLYGSTSLHSFTVMAKDQTNPSTANISGSGQLLMPVLPPSLPGPAGSAGTWGVREFRSVSALSTVASIADQMVQLPEADDDPGTNRIVDGTAPVMNHSDPISPGDQGNFNNDLPFAGHGGVEDNQMGILGKTQVVVPAAGNYTFSVHSDDGFALRISGGPAGNTSRFISSNRNTALNGIDGSDAQTIFCSQGSADSSTTGVYSFSAAGTYDVTFLYYEIGGGAYCEVAWAPGSFRWDRETTAWRLVGSPDDPAVTAVPFKRRFLTVVPGPDGGSNTWGIRTFYNATTGGTQAFSNWLNTVGSGLSPDGFAVFDEQRQFLNLSDSRNAEGTTLTQTGHVTNDDVHPGDKGVDANGVANVGVVAKGRVAVSAGGLYTFNARGDDGFLLRVKAVSGPDPKFSYVSHPDQTNGDAKLEMSNLNEMFYAGGTGDSLTRGVINLPAGEYDLEYLWWQATGGAWYELTAAAGEWPHGTEPPSGWLAVGQTWSPPPSAGLPVISPAGWTVEASAPGSLTAPAIEAALAALTATGTTSTWDAVNFNDPQSAGGAPTPAPFSAWPRNTPSDDDNYALRAKGNLVVTTAATYHLGYQSDDGGQLIIRGTGGSPAPSFEATLLENATGVGVVEAEDPVNAPEVLNKIRTETGTGNSRTIARIHLEPGTYEIEGLMYEIAGGSYWTVLGAIEGAETVVYYPLSKGGIVPGPVMLPLVAPGSPETIPVTNFSFNPATGAFELTWVSEAGASYQLEYSTAMEAGAAGTPEHWNTAAGGPIAGNAGTTTLTGNIAGIHPVNGGVLPVGAPRCFVRIRRL